MNFRAALWLTFIACAAASAGAQELVQVSYTWREVLANTSTPVSAPNSTVDPGEGAQISLHVEALINGSNAVGQTVAYTPPPPPGSGTVRGISNFNYDLVGDNGNSTAAGAWGPRSISPIFFAGAFTGNPDLGGAILAGFDGSQWVPVGGTANSTNPVLDAFRGVWTPASYSERSVLFKARPGPDGRFGQHNGILVAYSIARPDPNDPTTWYDNLLTKYIGSDFGSGVSIPIAPAPSTALIATLAIVFSPWPRRRPGAAP